MSMIRNSLVKATARRSISNSTKTNAALSLGHASVNPTAASAAAASSSASSSFAKAFKGVVYTSAVVAGAAYFVKDEVIYWTPNARK
ncbi:hypothetical protein BGZ94_001750 [Podila epigama]|nr:hypothetical protein BGZ94_001750 [Podila epigama]